jgi:vacuolar-type H+-ATPase subunit H
VSELNPRTIEDVLAIERDAVRVYEEAQREATARIEEAKLAATALHEETLTQAGAEAEEILAAGRKEAEAERARIIAQAKEEARHMEEMAASHFDCAVTFLLDQVIGSA